MAMRTAGACGLSVIPLLMAALLGCSLGSEPAVQQTEGPPVTAQQREILLSLQPEAERIVTETLAAGADDADALHARLEQLLRGAFGEDYQSFIVEETVSLSGAPEGRGLFYIDPNFDLHFTGRAWRWPFGACYTCEAGLYNRHVSSRIEADHLRLAYTDRSTPTRVRDAYDSMLVKLTSDWTWGWFPILRPTIVAEVWHSGLPGGYFRRAQYPCA